MDLNTEFTRVFADHLISPMPGNGRVRLRIFDLEHETGERLACEKPLRKDEPGSVAAVARCGQPFCYVLVLEPHVHRNRHLLGTEERLRDVDVGD